MYLMTHFNSMCSRTLFGALSLLMVSRAMAASPDATATPPCSEAVVNKTPCTVYVDRANPVTQLTFKFKPDVKVNVDVHKSPLDAITFVPSYAEQLKPDIFAAIGAQLFKPLAGLVGQNRIQGPFVANVVESVNPRPNYKGRVALYAEAISALKADIDNALRPLDEIGQDQQQLHDALAALTRDGTGKKLDALHQRVAKPAWAGYVQAWDMTDKQSFLTEGDVVVGELELPRAPPRRSMAALSEALKRVDDRNLQHEFIENGGPCKATLPAPEPGTLAHRYTCVTVGIANEGLSIVLREELKALDASFQRGADLDESIDLLDERQAQLTSELATITAANIASSQQADGLKKQLATIRAAAHDLPRCVPFGTEAPDDPPDSPIDVCRQFSTASFRKGNSGLAAPTASIKISALPAKITDATPLATVSLSWLDVKWALSAGFFVSTLKQRSFSVAPITANGTISRDPTGKAYTFISETSSSPTVEVVAMAHYRLASTSRCAPGCALYLSGGVGTSQNSSGPDVVFGPTVSYRSFMLSFLLNYTHDIKLTNGLYPGEPLTSSPPSSLPTEKYWTPKAAIAVTYMLPLSGTGGQ